MKNWYQAVIDDLGVDLLEARGETESGVSRRTLRTYKKEGNIPSIPAKREDILTLIQSVKPEYTMQALEKLWEKYEVKSNYKECTRNIKDALALIADKGIKITPPTSLNSNKPDKVSQWIMQEMRKHEGFANVGRLLEDLRDEVQDIEKVALIKNLLDAITPLVVANISCVEQAREKLLGIEGVDSDTGPVAAALAISLERAKAQTLSIEEDDDGFYRFKTPENAVVEKTFSLKPEEDLKQRIGNRLMPLLGIRSAGQDDIPLSDNHYKRINQHAKNSGLSAHPPYIYIEDDGEYPKDQLDAATDFSGLHRFSSEAEQVKVFHSDFALEWLNSNYGLLYEKEKELNPIEQLRKMLESLPDTEENKELKNLLEESNSMSDNDFLSKLENITTILSNTSQIAINIPEAMVNATTAFDKASILLSSLTQLIPSSGA